MAPALPRVPAAGGGARARKSPASEAVSAPGAGGGARKRKKPTSGVPPEVAQVVQPAASRPRSTSAAGLPVYKGYSWESDDDEALPRCQRCSNYVQGCTQVSRNGWHKGLCTHMLNLAPRRR